MKCPHQEAGLCTPCHNKAVWANVERRIIQAKVKGLERALRSEHMPAKAKHIRAEMESYKALLDTPSAS